VSAAAWRVALACVELAIKALAAASARADAKATAMEATADKIAAKLEAGDPAALAAVADAAKAEGVAGHE
jgi:predicted NBD/HSP70 family sugar kinase